MLAMLGGALMGRVNSRAWGRVFGGVFACVLNPFVKIFLTRTTRDEVTDNVACVMGD